MPALRYPNSLLFKISGNNLRRPSWLLGTMHMICASDFSIKDKIFKALLKCKKYYMEVDLGSQAELSTMQTEDKEGYGFEEGLSDEEREEMNQILISQFGLTLEQVRNIPPIALINKMTTDAIGCDDFVVAEMELLKLAQDAGLKTGGLETGMQQLKIAEKVFDGREILYQLKSSDDYKILFERMIRAYHAESLDDLAAFVTDERFMSPKAYKILVLDRNKRWALQIPKLIAEESSFIAVGAGHLPGEKGVINLLKLQGFSINPVYR